MKIDQTRVVLTGAAGGIGRAMVQALAEHGAAVLGVGRGASGPGHAWQRADLATPEGRQDILRLCALEGALMLRFMDLLPLQDSDWAAVFADLRQ